VIGITKAYTTRVGTGPFPTELDDSDGKHLREVGAEFRLGHGPPRRTGWLDLPGLRYASRVNGIDGLALTKLDVLTGMERIRVCVAYDTPKVAVSSLPIDQLDPPGPNYARVPGNAGLERTPGWRARAGRSAANARAYVASSKSKRRSRVPGQRRAAPQRNDHAAQPVRGPSRSAVVETAESSL
jgi:adenylosuccinate synthase